MSPTPPTAAAPPASLSVLIPAYNEAGTLALVVARVQAVDLPLPREIIVVDDGSTDATPEVLRSLPGVVAVRHPRNRGKGAAVRTGLARATGDIVLVQDADLELDPADIPRLLAPLLEGRAQAVYGSRNLEGKDPGRTLLFYLGGRLVTAAANLLYGLSLTDEVCGYKALLRRVAIALPLREERFAWEEELTAALARRGIAITEVPVRARSRSMKEGKKLRRRDGLLALWVLLRQRFRRP
jgi:glycosyltransferase involved in cell wall biosynthesis